MTDDRSTPVPAADPEHEDPAWLLDLEDDLRRAHTPGPEPTQPPSIISRLLGRG